MSGKKTTVTLPVELLLRVEELGRSLGVGRNGLIAMALAMALVIFSPLQKIPRRRRQWVLEAEKIFQNLLDHARKG